MRVALCYGLTLFLMYLTVVIVWLCIVGGLNGRQLTNVEERLAYSRSLRFVPFKALLLGDGLDCGCCLEPFNKNENVVQLKCHATHVFHRQCLIEWSARGSLSCPFCRAPISLETH